MKRLVFITILLAISGLGCSLGDTIKKFASSRAPSSNNGPSNTSGPTNTGGRSSAPTAASGDAKDDVIRMAKKFLELPSFTAQMDGTGTNEMHTRLEYISPDRYHITNTISGKNIETIIVGKDTYMKMGGSWQKFPVDVGSMIPNLRDTYTEEGLKTISDVKFEGDDTVDGKPALLYSYSNTTPKEHTSYKSKIWVSTETGQPMKVVIDYAGGSLKTMTILYDIETPVTIEPPVK